MLKFIVIAVAATFVLAGCTTSDTSTDTGSQESEETLPEAALPGIGDTAQANDLAFTITGLECGITALGSEFLPVNPQGQFCRVGIVIENVGSSPAVFSASESKVFDSQSREFAADTSAMIREEDSRDVWRADLNPGNSVSGNLIFDLPVDASPDFIEIEAGNVFDSSIVAFNLK
jgi:hypothetical protein